MKLSIIIVSYNTKKLTLDCLKSVYSSTLKDYEIILVDNNSSDGSVHAVKTKYPKVKVIENKDNVGFSKANNHGLKKSRGEYVLLLNSDTIVKPESLQNLVDFLDKNPKAGIVTAHLLNLDGSIQPAGGYLPNLINIKAWIFFLDDLPFAKTFFPSYHLDAKTSYQTTKQFGWVPGTAMVIRSTLVEKIGGLDEQIFMYAEDIDYCIRAKKAGYQIYHLINAPIIHLGQQSGAKESALLGEIKGLLYIYKKHKTPWQLAMLKLILKSGLLWRILIFATIRDKQKYEIYKKAYQLV